MLQLKLLLVLEFLWSGNVALADKPRFYCTQTATMANQIFEASYANCAKENEKPVDLKARKKVCMEAAYCAPDTADLRADVQLRLDGDKSKRKFTDLTPEEVSKLIVAGDNLRSRQSLKPSMLICQAVDGDCPSATKCQEDIFYNLKSTQPVTDRSDVHYDGGIAPGTSK